MSNPSCFRSLSSSSSRHGEQDPRIQDLGPDIEGAYANIRKHYDTPKYPLVLCHGFLGFAELQLIPKLPGLQYWRGIIDALEANKVEVLTPTVPPSDSVEDRAAALSEQIRQLAGGRSVNVIGHSMGGLDARYMVSQRNPAGVDVKSVVTLAAPHQGSTFADYLTDKIGSKNLSALDKVWTGVTGWDTGGFHQLTRKYVTEEFNAKTPDNPNVRYFSYGARLADKPSVWSPLLLSHKILLEAEGANDGLVSVESARWGTYKGTLVGVSHLDLINWTNRVRYDYKKWTGQEDRFNAIALYLDIADMLAKEGL